MPGLSKLLEAIIDDSPPNASDVLMAFVSGVAHSLPDSAGMLNAALCPMFSASLDHVLPDKPSPSPSAVLVGCVEAFKSLDVDINESHGDDSEDSKLRGWDSASDCDDGIAADAMELDAAKGSTRLAASACGNGDHMRPADPDVDDVEPNTASRPAGAGAEVSACTLAGCCACFWLR